MEGVDSSSNKSTRMVLLIDFDDLGDIPGEGGHFGRQIDPIPLFLVPLFLATKKLFDEG